MVGDGIKVAVRAFFHAEGDMDVYAGMSGFRFLLYGLWSLVYGFWSLVAGLWFNQKLQTRNHKPILLLHDLRLSPSSSLERFP